MSPVSATTVVMARNASSLLVMGRASFGKFAYRQLSRLRAPRASGNTACRRWRRTRGLRSLVLLIACRADRIGPERAETEQLRIGQLARGLALDLGVELRAEQNDTDGDPHPHHHADRGAEGAVSHIVIAEIGNVP